MDSARSESGQALILTVLAMVVVLAMATFAIDVASWYQKRHQAQVSADAAVLAAANCLASAGHSGNACTSGTDTTNAHTVATSYANSNNVPLSSIGFDTTNNVVSVTTATPAPVLFAGLFGVHPTVSAKAKASWTSGTVPFTFFAGNPTCGGTILSSESLQNKPISPGLTFGANDNGGGNETITGAYTAGQYTDNENSHSASITGTIGGSGGTPTCDPTNSPITQSGSAPEGGSANTNFKVNSSAVTNWPDAFTQPTCGHSATSWTTKSGGTNVLSGASTGVYCATGTDTTSCDSSVNLTTPPAGVIVLDSKVTNVTVVASCVIITNGASGSTPDSTDTTCTSQTEGTCPLAFSTGVLDALPSIYVENNGTLTSGVLYAPGDCYTGPSPSSNGLATDLTQCNQPGSTGDTSGFSGGTVELEFNHAITTFVEASNIVIDKNGLSATGTGPVSALGTDALTG